MRVCAPDATSFGPDKAVLRRFWAWGCALKPTHFGPDIRVCNGFAMRCAPSASTSFGSDTEVCGAPAVRSIGSRLHRVLCWCHPFAGGQSGRQRKHRKGFGVALWGLISRASARRPSRSCAVKIIFPNELSMQKFKFVPWNFST